MNWLICVMNAEGLVDSLAEKIEKYKKMGLINLTRM
jgi:hypothetical protein